MSNEAEETVVKESLNFIEQIIEDDNASGKHDGRVQTRFPPEPNGYLHLGHAKSICLNFGTSEKYNGLCNLRFDDTNPEKEDTEYVEAIKEDVAWLGYKWDEREFHASDYFQQLYDGAVQLIKQGDAFVDDLSKEEIAERRGTPTRPGTESPYRNRSVEENLDLFERMKAGEFDEGQKVLRAKVDMTSPNMHMRDPALYRIKKDTHQQTGDEWVIYPMYDYAHCMSDSIEKVTHSLCTLEFEVHRPIYDWILDKLGRFRPQQIEFARLNVGYTVVSKRKLLQLVEEKHVDAWDDPRMPTLSGMRRRGYTPASIRNFCEKVGVAKRDGIVDVALLEYSVREDLNKVANRAMVVLDPIKVVITNIPEGTTETLTAINNPEDESAGTRDIPFGREILIDREDFMEDAPRKYFRLKPEGLVRLKYAYIIKCNEVIKDSDGNIEELRCEYYPESKSGQDNSGIKVKGTIHWVEASNAIDIEARLYDRLFTEEDPIGTKEENKNFIDAINPDSLEILNSAKAEPSLGQAMVGDKFQFERKGYFCLDSRYSTPEKPVFNRTVALRDSWAKKQGK